MSARILLFDADDRFVLVEEEGRWMPAPGSAGDVVWRRGDLVLHSRVIAPGEEPAGSRWWTLGEFLAERPPHDPPELVDLIRRQLPSCFA